MNILRKSGEKLIWRCAAIFGVIIAAVFVTSVPVIQSATRIAGASPYCVQIADGKGDYTPARTLVDLSVFLMRATSYGGRYLQHHAVLIVSEGEKPRLFHWSYRNSNFEVSAARESDPFHGITITCIPQRDYIGTLSILIPKVTETDYVRFSTGETYRIPKTYRPEWNGGSSAHLFVRMRAPDFRPPQWTEFSQGEFDSDQVMIDWDSEWLLSLMTSFQNKEVTDRTTEFGLQKFTTKVNGTQYLVYADRTPNSPNTTLISCFSHSERFPAEKYPYSCQHRFLHDGKHFYFRHRPEDLPNWQDMQKQLLDVVTSFEVPE